MKRTLALTILIALLVATRANAVIITGPLGRNTTPPINGPLKDSGWQYQGDWGAFSGTPIAPGFFITAGHVGGSPGSTFNFNGVDYPTVAFFDDPASDLRIWQIDGTFPAYASLYTKRNERGKRAVLIGRGKPRGEEVRIGKTLKGWLWGEADHVRSWGTNTVGLIAPGAEGVGDTLRFSFDARRSPNEGTLAEGDSGGGVFLKDNGVWRLAAVNYGVESPFSLTGSTDDPGFSAALLDEGGFYQKDPTTLAWTFLRDRPANIPEYAYSTRISSNLIWITSVLDGTSTPDGSVNPTNTTGFVPEPSLLTLLPLLYFARRPLRRRRV
jgi:hypothetical protein